MNKISILAIIIGIILVGIIAAIGFGTNSSILDIQNSTSQVVIEEESSTKHFSVSLTDNVGISDVRP